MAHIHTANGDFDYTVAGYLVHNSKTLLIKHKYLPLWTAPAGHVEVNESPIDALYKEIDEEAGIHVSHLELIDTSPSAQGLQRSEGAVYIPVPFSMEYHTITPEHRHINMAYVLRCDTDTVHPQAGESQTYRWFSHAELEAFTETNASIRSEAMFALECLEEKTN